MTENKGKLIVIEGVDGSGKETQTKKLFERLEKEGINIKRVAYPRYHEPSSAMVKMYLKGEFGEKPEDVGPYIASTFYAIDRYASYKQDYGEFYHQGGIVIADRYTTSNMVHQAGKIVDPVEREKFLHWLWDYEFNLYGLPIPDLVFFLDIPVETNQKLMEGRKNKFSGEMEQDIHEKDKEHLIQSYKNALSLVDKYHWTKISCVENHQLKSIEEIHEEIYQIFREKMITN
ncbi:thymidylate kinase [Irregularibacter muris]|uniref:Thymidylate kinase n=1 Tax=Irregularibacter muris TaxID=1796619 RepID=A0AAE3HIG8_9FIRM|nr:thymidylate kinase [Irregularibacter muris]MCR1899539.1 thymidylate kinase [Irregularibacter muris]